MKGALIYFDCVTDGDCSSRVGDVLWGSCRCGLIKEKSWERRVPWTRMSRTRRMLQMDGMVPGF